jgi:hypothetical protein
MRAKVMDIILGTYAIVIHRFTSIRRRWNATHGV